MIVRPYSTYIVSYEFKWKRKGWEMIFTRRYEESSELSLEDFFADACAKKIERDMAIPYKQALRGLRLISLVKKQGFQVSDEERPTLSATARNG